MLITYPVCVDDNTLYWENDADCFNRHVTDVISVVSRQSRAMSVVCLSNRSVISEHSRKFYLDYNRDYINLDDIINNNLILSFFCRALINLLLDYNNILLDYNNLLPDYNNLLLDYNNPIIIYYYYNPRININPSCPVKCSKYGHGKRALQNP